MKKQLYIQNEKGNFEPLYQRLSNGEYVPLCIHVETNDLTYGNLYKRIC